MKYFFALSLTFLFLLKNNISAAQTFTVLNDTINISCTPGDVTYFDSTVTGTAMVTYSWEVINCNFPTDWLSPTESGLCDNVACYSVSSHWPSGYTDTVANPPNDTGLLSLNLFLTSTSSSGCYFLTVKLHNISVPADSAIETWSVCYASPTGISTINNNTDDVFVYPNPVNDELHLHYDLNADISKIEVYDLLGKLLKVANCSQGSATVWMSDAPAGVYFARLTDMKGEIVHTLRIIKE